MRWLLERVYDSLQELVSEHVEVTVRVEPSEDEADVSVASNRRGPEEDLEAVRELHDEARTVLDHQIDHLRDVDDKAARTTRITAILIGGVLGIVSLGGQSGVSMSNPYVMWGSASLVLSMIIGIATYNVSSAYFGPGSESLRQLLGESDEGQVLDHLVRDGYTNWVSEMNVKQAVNGLSLDLTQASLAVGLLYLVLGFLHHVTTPVSHPFVHAQLEAHKGSIVFGLPLGIVVLATTLLYGYAFYRDRNTS